MVRAWQGEEPATTENEQTRARFQLLRVMVRAVRATAVGRDAERNAERNAVLAGGPKGIRLLCNTTLITDIPSRGSKEERIRIHLQVWANIRNNGYKR